MITLFMTLLLFTSVKTSGIKEIQVKKLKRGENVVLNCNTNNAVWLKQSYGNVPQWIVRRDETSVRVGLGLSNKRFSINEPFHLNITNLKEEDTGTYFCADVQSSSLHFGPGTFLVVEAEEVRQRPPTVTVMEDGKSLTLQCSVQAFTPSCEEQSVYWFRHRSGEPHSGIIYTHGDGSDECKKISEAGSPTQSCVYTLPKGKLTTSDNGTFYCAVAACGQILFTNGIKVEENQMKENSHWITFALTTSNLIFLIVIMVLVGVLIKKQR
ncbi:M1-specific T cell receptor beta chain-like, partial [Clarias gariepinus]|uniref:M1-specific T cell receptor beta chain-like n=1 Tax=Clarias gariepinus TaxID=13013 RepID=UPI00234DAADC